MAETSGRADGRSFCGALGGDWIDWLIVLDLFGDWSRFLSALGMEILLGWFT